jgi:hypothetical protein
MPKYQQEAGMLRAQVMKQHRKMEGARDIATSLSFR